ncbi:hypothetical protein FRB94_006945 [Tulasnella sp. JGI-2019a]|nr:hypothetical protein FRB93_001386 [Tulasnella sp. JGI-2019a]KAG8998289.1 hypothetical protein FRB94_006945 [Tulasnella sp. JGI-2019a]KAG9031271.1 hypothetical protein FRB95_002911 [Tulasnella sp. JGI-2019a]
MSVHRIDWSEAFFGLCGNHTSAIDWRDSFGDGQATIAANGRQLSTWAASATNGTKDLLQGEQSKFEEDVNARVEDMKRSIAGILRKPAVQMTKAIESATATHVAAVGKQLVTTTTSKPV